MPKEIRNEIIQCACGCGKTLTAFDDRGRRRRFINGHNKSNLGNRYKISKDKLRDSRKTAICKTCGKEFKYYPSKTKGIFCCKQCQYDYDYPGCIWKGKNGYLYYQKGRGEKVLLHRLIATAKPGEIVHHKDGDKLNNDPENLEILPSQSEHIRKHVNPVLFRWARRRAANAEKTRRETQKAGREKRADR